MPDARATIDRAMSEAEWQRIVVACAEASGWTCWHDNDSRWNDSGFPDLVMFRERTIYAELKTEKGRVRPVQAWFHQVLRDAHAEFYLWRPRDWPDVQRILARLPPKRRT